MLLLTLYIDSESMKVTEGIDKDNERASTFTSV